MYVTNGPVELESQHSTVGTVPKRFTAVDSNSCIYHISLTCGEKEGGGAWGFSTDCTSKLITNVLTQGQYTWLYSPKVLVDKVDVYSRLNRFFYSVAYCATSSRFQGLVGDKVILCWDLFVLFMTCGMQDSTCYTLRANNRTCTWGFTL